jgi:TonB family protein
MLSFLAAAAVLFQASAAAAPAPRVSVITQPDWLRRPSGEDLTRLYPKAALAKRLEGFATIQCHVTATGELADCRTIDEAPLGEGFGEAAVAMAATFKMRPMAKDGAPVDGGTVRIPIRFKLPADQTIPAEEFVLRCYGYSAAAAEKDPSSEKAQFGSFAWGMVTQMYAVTEKVRPSELDARLLAARRIGETPAASGDAAQADRERCDAMMESAGLSRLRALLDQLPH